MTEPISCIYVPLSWWLYPSASVDDDVIRKASSVEYVLYEMLYPFSVKGLKEVETEIISSVPINELPLPEIQMHCA